MAIKVARAAPQVSVRVLGEFQVSLGAGTLSVLPAMPQSLLAVLVAEPDALMTNAELVEELWGDSPPTTATNLLQGYVLQIRRALTAALQAEDSWIQAKDILRTSSGGYRFSLLDGTSDIRTFRAFMHDGHHARELGTIESASGCFKEALSCWRGNPFDGVEEGPRLAAHGASLREERLVAEELWMSCELERGRYREQLSRLAMLTRQHPGHEVLYSQYMIALDRCGRRAEAHEAYLRLVGYLREKHDMGVSASVERLHHSIVDVRPEPEPVGVGHRRRIDGQVAQLPWRVSESAVRPSG